MKSVEFAVVVVVAVVVAVVVTVFPFARIRAESPAELARASRDAVVVISAADRQGRDGGLGTGFFVREDGVIATNYHVVGDHRRLRVELTDGRKIEPIEVLAVERERDLALIRVDLKDRPVLELGESGMLKDGQPIVSVGNPLGFEWSVSQGVVAATRDVDGRSLIQVAMPIEPGSSGSPVIDAEGKVVGILAIKSGAALGFAVPIDDLKPLLADPRPIPMSRWLSIGGLDPDDWRPVFGGRWRQRAGSITATGKGGGFGGRMLCLSQSSVLEGNFEVEVRVRLDDESGAAGLAFHADGGNKHYGFYPTNGSLRLTRFEGPDVFSWTIIETVPSPAYLPGEWNRIRVRVAGAHLTCSVNGSVVIDAKDDGLAAGKVGLVKFRDPSARFRGFRVASKLDNPERDRELAKRVEAILGAIDVDALSSGAPRAASKSASESSVIAKVAELGAGAARVLVERAAELERRAATLRRLSERVHRRVVLDELRALFVATASPPDDDPKTRPDLLRAALLISKLDNPDLDVAAYVAKADRMARRVKSRFPKGASDAAKLDALVAYLFEELGFHGSRLEYYTRANSYINDVLDDREGIPITLSLVFIELARRAGVEVVGVGIPAHFIVGHRLGEEESERLIDVFNEGKTISREDAESLSGVPLAEADFKAADAKAIVTRMLRNLRGVAEREGDTNAVLAYLDAILAVDEDAVYERWRRAQVRFQTGDLDGTAKDVDALLEDPPPELDPAAIRALREFLERQR